MSEAEEYFETKELVMDKEGQDAARVFRFAVRADQSNHFFCDSYTEEIEGDRTRLTLTGAWTRDSGLPNRYAETIVIVARAYDITTLPKGEL